MRHFKLVTLGDEDTGKTCLIKAYCEERFEGKYIPTIGLDYGLRAEPNAPKPLALNIFDLSGDPFFAPLLPEMLSDAQVILVCYVPGLTSESRIVELDKLIQTNANKPILKYLGGCKKDLHFSREKFDAQKFSERNGYLHLLTSARDHRSVKILFKQIVDKLAFSKPDGEIVFPAVVQTK